MLTVTIFLFSTISEVTGSEERVWKNLGTDPIKSRLKDSVSYPFLVSDEIYLVFHLAFLLSFL